MATMSERVGEALDRWLECVGPRRSGDGNAVALPDSYLQLARFVLDHGLGSAGDAKPPTVALDRLLAEVARTNRRAGRTISSTLASFAPLPSAVLSLARPEDTSDEALEVFRAAHHVDATLDYALARLVRILEESAARTRREQARAMEAMMDVLSHELDNRLGAARTAADILDNPRIELGDEDLGRVGRLVRSSLDDALRTVDDVRALVGSWGEEGAAAGRGRSLALPVLLRKLVDELEPVADEAGVRLHLPSDQADVVVDAGRLRLVLYNLVSNGIRYHDPDEDDRLVRIESQRLDDGRIRIRVEDNGIGIPRSQRENVFLYRARVDEGIDGSGLGLAIAREAVDQLGGSLELESELGEGTTFTMTLHPQT